MSISFFISMLKDFFLLILGACSMAVGSLFNMPLFLSISVGQVLLGIIAFKILFGHLLQIIRDRFM